MNNNVPHVISDEITLDHVLTHPRPELVEYISEVQSPLLILGAAGKMGPSLAVLARRAADEAGVPLEVIAVSRFSDEAILHWLEEHSIRVIRCDLMDHKALDALPDTANLIYLVGMKFGTSQNPARTWAFNTLIPANVCQRFPKARMVALSTGNVYPMRPVDISGSVETDPLTPLGEYANSSVARERIFEYYSQQNATRMALIRLNYAVDLRYGVLADIALKVFKNQPVDVSMGYLNCIWQGDANDMIIRSLGLAQSPSIALNLTGVQTLTVRELAQRFGELMGTDVQIVGNEADTALLSDPDKIVRLLGAPPTSLEQMMHWTVNWIVSGGRLLGKPTHFEQRDGNY